MALLSMAALTPAQVTAFAVSVPVDASVVEARMTVPRAPEELDSVSRAP